MKTSFIRLKKQAQRGFTLVEIAIVLVIIGLLIGGVLRGQELISSARVRNLVAQSTGIQSAYFGFLDRYKATPGDLSAADALLVAPNASAALTNQGDGLVDWTDSPQFFNNLAQAGFINCAQCMTKITTVPLGLTITNSPTSAFGSPVWFESATGGTTVGNAMYLTAFGITESARPKLSTGNNVSTPLLAEMDRKVDDGNPATGIFRVSGYNANVAGGQGITVASCFVGNTGAAVPATWTISPVAQCEGVSLF
jgi:prepilin-type N-terminal cleavage/methylation domain-containing protein